jgi:hypothetical protein
VDDLIAFLRARLDETAERAPRTHLSECATTADWYYGGTSDCDCGEPARVLADVDAKRRIIDEHAIVHRNIGWLADGDEEYGEIPVCGRCVPKHSHYSRRADVPEGWCRTLRLLALPYADHPDYRAEWRP